ncbi:MAG: hypothetical protein JW969_02430 [Spirochaetales bacterium]|nr:hypothetical protein [Spirochaetales bacterium]
MDRKKILIPYVDAGSGHKRTANAIGGAIQDLYPGKFDVEVVDFPKAVGAKVSDKVMLRFWNMALGNPKFSEFSFRLMEKTHPLPRVLLPVFFYELIQKGNLYIQSLNPDIVCATHYYPASVSCIAREKCNLNYQVIGCITDPFTSFSFWADRKYDDIITASKESYGLTVKLGIPRHRIHILPFPVEKKFFNIQKTREQVEEEYGIDPKMKTFLISFGGEGIGSATDYVLKMEKSGLPFNVIFICGKNEELLRNLIVLKKKSRSRTKIIPLGFVENMHELLMACDFAVGKAGPSTIFEALTLNVPYMITGYSSLQELPNIKFVTENGFGWNIENEADFFIQLGIILGTDVLNEYRRNIARSRFVKSLRKGADSIAKFVVDKLSD